MLLAMGAITARMLFQQLGGYLLVQDIQSRITEVANAADSVASALAMKPPPQAKNAAPMVPAVLQAHLVRVEAGLPGLELDLKSAGKISRIECRQFRQSVRRNCPIARSALAGRGGAPGPEHGNRARACNAGIARQNRALLGIDSDGDDAPGHGSGPVEYRFAHRGIALRRRQTHRGPPRENCNARLPGSIFK